MYKWWRYLTFQQLKKYKLQKFELQNFYLKDKMTARVDIVWLIVNKIAKKFKFKSQDLKKPQIFKFNTYTYSYFYS